MAEVLALLEAPGVDADLQMSLRQAISVVREALHVYSKPRELVFSFNGGKDSTVVLHVIRAAILQRDMALGALLSKAADAADVPSLHASTPASATNADEGHLGGAVPVVYFESSNNFPEVLSFMDQAARQYNFSIRRLPGFKAGLEQLVSEGVRGVLMGTRSTDPDGGQLQFFTPTSLHWPACMRICPALQWSYSTVWSYLRSARLPYCGLYDVGYTSLGSVHDSTPNPLLLVHGNSGSADATAPPHQKPASEALPLSSLPPSHSPQPPPPTAGILLIGDELLSGQVADVNGPFLAAQLSGVAGFRVSEVCVVPDDVGAIAAAVARLRESCSVVVTSGGLGPTHDDVTIEGVAEAFGYPLATCPSMASLLRALSRRHSSSSSCSERTGSGAAGGPTGHDMARLPCGPLVRVAYGDDAPCTFSQHGVEAPCVSPTLPLTPLGGAPYEPPVGAAPSPAGAGSPQGSSLLPGPGTAASRSSDDDDGSDAATDAALIARGYPLVSVGNVFIFPGVPSILRRKWGAWVGTFKEAAAAGGGRALLHVALRVGAEEAAIAGVLERCARGCGAALKVGSYPLEGHPGGARVSVVLSGTCQQQLEDAAARLAEELQRAGHDVARDGRGEG